MRRGFSACCYCHITPWGVQLFQLSQLMYPSRFCLVWAGIGRSFLPLSLCMRLLGSKGVVCFDCQLFFHSPQPVFGCVWGLLGSPASVR